MPVPGEIPRAFLRISCFRDRSPCGTPSNATSGISWTVGQDACVGERDSGLELEDAVDLGKLTQYNASLGQRGQDVRRSDCRLGAGLRCAHLQFAHRLRSFVFISRKQVLHRSVPIVVCSCSGDGSKRAGRSESVRSIFSLRRSETSMWFTGHWIQPSETKHSTTPEPPPTSSSSPLHSAYFSVSRTSFANRFDILGRIIEVRSALARHQSVELPCRQYSSS